jgi:hypothetical protein
VAIPVVPTGKNSSGSVSRQAAALRQSESSQAWVRFQINDMKIPSWLGGTQRELFDNSLRKAQILLRMALKIKGILKPRAPENPRKAWSHGRLER